MGKEIDKMLRVREFEEDVSELFYIRTSEIDKVSMIEHGEEFTVLAYSRGKKYHYSTHETLNEATHQLETLAQSIISD